MRKGLIRSVLWLVARGLFRLQIRGAENVPERGPAVLASNHVTYLDGFLIWFYVPCAVRFLVWKPCFGVPGVNWALRFIGAIPVADGEPRTIRMAIRLARTALAEGDVVCIFPEGSLTRTGRIHPFRRGTQAITEGLDVPIIPVHLAGLWGSVFSFEGGRAIWKWPKYFQHPGTISFGMPMPGSSSAGAVQDAVEALNARARHGLPDSMIA